jgi:hypothetical protein
MPSDPPFHPLTTNSCRPACAVPCLPVNGFPGWPLWCGLFGRISSHRLQMAPGTHILPPLRLRNYQYPALESTSRAKAQPKDRVATDLQPAKPSDTHAPIQLSRPDQLFSFRLPVFGRANLRLAPSAQGSHHRIHAPAGSSRWIGEPAAYQPS